MKMRTQMWLGGILFGWSALLFAGTAMADDGCGKDMKKDDRTAQCREKCGTHKLWSYKQDKCVHASTRCREEGGTWMGASCQGSTAEKERCKHDGGTWMGLYCQSDPNQQAKEQCERNGDVWGGLVCFPKIK